VDDQEEYKVNDIKDSKIVRGKLRYLVEWRGYPERHEWTWEPTTNVKKNAPEKVEDFHKKHPSAPRPAQLNELTFINIPTNKLTEFNTLNVPTWTDGKELANPWEIDQIKIAELPITQEVEEPLDISSCDAPPIDD
jgi:hypothetical protein